MRQSLKAWDIAVKRFISLNLLFWCMHFMQIYVYHPFTWCDFNIIHFILYDQSLSVNVHMREKKDDKIIIIIMVTNTNNNKIWCLAF